MGGKRTTKPPAVDLDKLTGELAALRMLVGDAMMSEACELLRERMKLTAEKVSLVLQRRVFPDACVGQGEEANLRGMKPDTLREAKQRGEFAREMTGLQIPVKSENG